MRFCIVGAGAVRCPGSLRVAGVEFRTGPEHAAAADSSPPQDRPYPGKLQVSVDATDLERRIVPRP